MNKILVIEDNPGVRENLSELLEISGYEVHQAENGKIGVEIAREVLPDIILCDIMMPILDGYGVLYLLGKHPETAGIPFIFLTAKADVDDVRKGMLEGADDYITKPYDDIELLRAIERRLLRKQQLNEVTGGVLGQFKFGTDTTQSLSDLRGLFSEEVSKKMSPKEVVYSEGDRPRFVYFVEFGEVKLIKNHESGKELIIKVCGPGDMFGSAELFSDEVYSSSAVSMREGVCYMVSKEDFLKVFSSDLQLTYSIAKEMAKQIKEDQHKLMGLAYNSVRKRVALALVELAGKHEGGSEGAFFPAMRSDISSMVGTASESVIRVLSEFKEDGFIEIKGRKIALLNPEKLTKMPY